MFCSLADVPMLDWPASALLGQRSWSLMCGGHHFLCSACGRPPAPADTLAAAGGRKVVALRPQCPALRAVVIVLPVCLPQTFLPFTARNQESLRLHGTFKQGVTVGFVTVLQPQARVICFGRIDVSFLRTG